jgi:hypothetical protein
MVHDMSTHAAVALLWKNFTCVYPLQLLTSLSEPSEKLSKYRPSLNLLGLENQLHLIGTVTLGFLGIIVAFNYY